MRVTRKPLQIFLIEHLFYPFLLFLGGVFLFAYGPKVLVRHPVFSVETSILILGLAFLILYMLTLHVWIPYSCVRLWVSAGEYCKSWGVYFWRGYSGLVFVILVGMGLLILFDLPSFLQEVRGLASTRA